MAARSPTIANHIQTTPQPRASKMSEKQQSEDERSTLTFPRSTRVDSQRARALEPFAASKHAKITTKSCVVAPRNEAFTRLPSLLALRLQTRA